jgi:hypothetical protein
MIWWRNIGNKGKANEIISGSGSTTTIITLAYRHMVVNRVTGEIGKTVKNNARIGEKIEIQINRHENEHEIPQKD